MTGTRKSVTPDLDLPVVEFDDPAQLHEWLVLNHRTSTGVWVRLRAAGCRAAPVTFFDLLSEGLCFGWSESTRRAYDDSSYLQRFTPRRRPGTESARNRRLVAQLEAADRMTPAGWEALGMAPSGAAVA